MQTEHLSLTEYNSEMPSYQEFHLKMASCVDIT